MSDIKDFTLIKQGAEAKIYTGTYLGQPVIIKERFIKKYRHSELDTILTKDRIKAEARAMVRCKYAGIYTPTLYLVDFDRRRIYMEYFRDSVTAKEYIADYENKIEDKKNVELLANEIGIMLGKMHLNDIIHGDLTTSNILLVKKPECRKPGNDISNYMTVLIDFGLAHIDKSPEDKGVDLYVLERALLSTHKNAKEFLPIIMSAYSKTYKKGAKEVLGKFEEVRARGRKRTMVG